MASFDEVIPPGQAGRVSASVRTAELRGPMDRSITVTTDDPTQPTVSLGLHLDVKGSVLLLPRPFIDLRPGPTEGPSVARLLVRKEPDEAGELRVSDARVDASWLRVSARRVEVPEPASGDLPEARPGDFVLEVGAADLREGSSKQTLEFDTGLPIEPRVAVPVRAFVRPRIFVSPESLRFGPVEADGKRHATALVSVREDVGEAPLTVEGPAGLVGTAQPAGARRYWVQLSWEGEGEPGGHVVFRVGRTLRNVAIGGAPTAP